jgi:TolA-binding protein
MLLPLLLKARRHGEALKLVKARLQADPEFRPLASAELIKLAELARDGGERPVARALLHDFDRRFPDDPAHSSAKQLAELLER